MLATKSIIVPNSPPQTYVAATGPDGAAGIVAADDGIAAQTKDHLWLWLKLVFGKAKLCLRNFAVVYKNLLHLIVGLC